MTNGHRIDRLDALRSRPGDRSAAGGVTRSGHVHLPLAVECIGAGFPVTGVGSRR